MRSLRHAEESGVGGQESEDRGQETEATTEPTVTKLHNLYKENGAELYASAEPVNGCVAKSPPQKKMGPGAA